MSTPRPRPHASHHQQKASTHVDKAINYVNTILAIHNKAMLSRNLAVTIAEVTSLGLQALGAKDSNGNPLDVTSAIGKTVTNLVQGVIGVENYANLSTAWKKASTVYNSTTNVLYSVQGLFDRARALYVS